MRDVSQISVTPEYDRLVNGHGQIVREQHYYEVRWTEVAAGYVDVDYMRTFILPELAAEFVADLMKRLKRLP